ncbi:MAG: hypothetical protein KF909_07015 [Rhodocyclaceae bacterium]|jgi:hypothetical protein|nr:hypothetical protein [Rhodocyclaceae bacterium]
MLGGSSVLRFLFMVSGQMRLSILNAPDDMTPLKLRGWLRGEAESIQGLAKGEHDMIVIRLFLSERLRLATTQKQLDKILQGIVDRFPNIYRVELRPVTKALTVGEMAQAAEEAQTDLQEMLEDMKQDEDDTPTRH